MINESIEEELNWILFINHLKEKQKELPQQVQDFLKDHPCSGVNDYRIEDGRLTYIEYYHVD